MSSIRTIALRRAAIAVVLALMLVACDWKGPAPTDASLTAASGPFAVSTLVVPSSAGFGGGTIYYPNNVAGPFAAISVSPGFFGTQSAIAAWGPRLASHGFVVVTINTTSLIADPTQRSIEQRQALTYVVNQGNTPSSPIFGLVDGNRTGVAGHSMGGGASLISAQADPSIDAVMPLAPWNLGSNFQGITSPTLVLACQADGVAAPNTMASPMYNSIPATTTKMYISVTNGDHSCANAPTGGGNDVGRYGVAFFKRWLDADTRYDPWMCGASAPTAGGTLNEVRSSCPF
jgi:triacylglycerol lipase